MNAGGRPNLSPTRSELQRYRGAQLGRAIWSLATSVAALAGAWAIALHLYGWLWWSCLAVAPLGGLCLVRLFCIQHDCGHGSFLKSVTANNILGRAISVLTLAPYAWWRATHAHHHAVVGKLESACDVGYFDLWTTTQWHEASWGSRLAYQLQRSIWFLGLVGGPLQFIVFHRWPKDTPARLRHTLQGVLLLNLSWATLLLAAAWADMLVPITVIQLSFAWAAAGIGASLFLTQHTFDGAYHSSSESWSWHQAALHGSSYLRLPRVLAWFTADIGLHHVHHLDAQIPHYRLREALRSVPELQRVPDLDLFSAIRSARLKLWSPEASGLVGLPKAAK